MEFAYPEASRDETIVDKYYDYNVPDPYRWLEEMSEETKEFIDSQNALTESYLDSMPEKQSIEMRLDELRSTVAYSCPEKRGERYFFYKYEPNLFQPVVYTKDNLRKQPTVLFNPNAIWLPGSVCFYNSKFSTDGNIFAYEVSIGGSEWKQIRFMNTVSGESYPEILVDVKYSFISWTHDSLGIFYGRCLKVNDASQNGTTENVKYLHKVYYHRVGTPQSQDVLAVEFLDNPEWIIKGVVSDCGRWLIVSATEGICCNLVFFAEMPPWRAITEKFDMVQIIDVMEADFGYVTNYGTLAIFRSNLDAPNYRLITIDLCNFAVENWSELLPEHPQKTLKGMKPVGEDKFIAHFSQDGRDILELHCMKTGKVVRSLLPDYGTVVGFFAEKRTNEVLFKFTSFLTAGIVYRMDVSKNFRSYIFHESRLPNFDSTMYDTAQVFFTSKDGTSVPMFIVTKVGAKRDGTMPTLLTGNGGKGAISPIVFTPLQLIFMTHFKGVYAVAGIRGGGEYGKAWHSDGTLLNKQNSFDDFQCAAEFLIKCGYTNNKKLVILGEYNGGLLTGACLTQRPELFGAVLAISGPMDMIRYQDFAVGDDWRTEYGDIDEKEEFENLIQYSPLHNVEQPADGGQFPATLILTCDHDTRVLPMHSLKFIATLQHEIGRLPQQRNPLLARISDKTGHGSESISRSFNETVNMLLFCIKALGLEYRV